MCFLMVFAEACPTVLRSSLVTVSVFSKTLFSRFGEFLEELLAAILFRALTMLVGI